MFQHDYGLHFKLGCHNWLVKVHMESMGEVVSCGVAVLGTVQIIELQGL